MTSTSGSSVTKRIAAHLRRAREQNISPLDIEWQRELRALHRERMSELRNRSDEEWHEMATIPIQEVDRMIAESGIGNARSRRYQQADRRGTYSDITLPSSPGCHLKRRGRQGYYDQRDDGCRRPLQRK